VQSPVHVLRASRGVHGYDLPLIARHQLLRLAAVRPDARVKEVWGVNHYTLVLGASPGPRRVAATLELASQHHETAALPGA
jgi:hypothetical protein